MYIAILQCSLQCAVSVQLYSNVLYSVQCPVPSGLLCSVHDPPAEYGYKGLSGLQH